MLGKQQNTQICRTILLRAVKSKCRHLINYRAIIIFYDLRVYCLWQIKRTEQVYIQVRQLCPLTRQFLIPHAILRASLCQNTNVGFTSLNLAWAYANPSISLVADRRICRREHRYCDDIPFRKRELFHRHRRRWQEISIRLDASERRPFLIINSQTRNLAVILHAKQKASRLAAPRNVICKCTNRLPHFVSLVKGTGPLHALALKSENQPPKFCLGH